MIASLSMKMIERKSVSLFPTFCSILTYLLEEHDSSGSRCLINQTASTKYGNGYCFPFSMGVIYRMVYFFTFVKRVLRSIPRIFAVLLLFPC
ncbi:hypothetical protein ES703_85148 [subsurface metagenome]